MRHIFGLVAAILGVLSSTSAAKAQQNGFYGGVSITAAQLEGPQGFDGSAFYPSFTFGYAFERRHSVEFNLSRIEIESTEPWAGPSAGEAPLTLGLRATPLSLAYRYRIPLRAERFQPFVGVGMTWSRVVDSWQSDTPRESRLSHVYGVNAQLLLRLGVTQRLSVVSSASYRHIEDASDRPARRFGLTGSLFSIGMLLHR